MPRLIDADALMSGFDVRKVVEYDESGCGMDYKAVPVEAIVNAPTIDAEPVRHGRWKHIKKHLWCKDEKGEIDMWYIDYDFHNGPCCEICGRSFCEHCEPDWAEKECDIGYYVCSECEQSTKTGESNYCPNCGAKMDLEVQDE